MTETHYSHLVNEAINKRDAKLKKVSQKSLSFGSSQNSRSEFEALAHDIKLINDHIKVDDEIFDEASSDYENIAKKAG